VSTARLQSGKKKQSEDANDGHHPQQPLPAWLDSAKSLGEAEVDVLEALLRMLARLLFMRRRILT
jgi:phage terminase small subunit